MNLFKQTISISGIQLSLKSMFEKWFLSWVAFLFFFCTAALIHAQPVNDNWVNAITIPIPDNNFGVGVIQSTIVNMTGATNQPGEYLQNPTYNKTVWYKFSIPSHRLVRVKVLQPTEILQSTDAGFFVYHSTSAIPGAGDMAVYTPMFSLASYSENVCLEQGEYYVQVIAKNVANSDLFVELDVSYTYPVSTSHAHDQVENAFNIGTLGSSHSYNFSWDCLSIQSDKEYDSQFGIDSIEYTKSIWYRFTTDSHVDLYSFYVNYPNWALNNAPVGIRIFEGAVSMATMDTSSAVYHIARPMNSTYSQVLCLLKANTEYYVQILGRINYTGSSNFYMRHLGEGVTQAPIPQEVGFNPLNDFGSIVPTPTPGTTVTREDYFSCEALLSNPSTQCGVVNPANSVTLGGVTYDLTTWFTLDIPNPANVLLRAYVQNQTCNSQNYGHSMYVRIFNQTPDNDCANFTLPGSLYYEGVFGTNGAIVMNCLPVGSYSIQLLARSNLAADPYHCNNSQFGRRVNFAITATGVPSTEHALLFAGDVDWINSGNALQDNVIYTADSSSFSCQKTVIPDTAICSPIVDRAMYRQILIGDADNDAVPDSGMVTIENYNYYNGIQNHLVKSVFYKGDAEQLAATQSAYAWPTELSGLDPYEGCNMFNTFFRPWWPYDVPHNPKKFCVTPGTYTLVNVGDSTENGAIMAPRFKFTKATTNHWNPSNAYDMGDIIAQGLNVISPVDTFSCRDNPDTIAGLPPCNGYTKLIYREFYISQECRITVDEISSTVEPQSLMRVFRGRVSVDGLSGLTLAPYHSSGCYSHYSDYTLPPCATVPAGWYTAVSYGYGPTYDNNYSFHEATTYTNFINLYNIDHTSAIRVIADTTVPPGPFFNRPHKACVANNDAPLTWVNTGTASIPSAATNYTLCLERFKPIQDTPFAAIPILGCASTVRVAFYVFSTDAEYYVRISGIDGYYKELYPLDVRTDSLLLPTTAPIAACSNYGNMIEICRLQPGTYTLVVYGTATQNCVTFTPQIAVQPVDVSRFDFAVNAYDFGLVPGDNVYHPGKLGDVHPTDPSLLPSNDHFYCTTGAFSSDPSGACTNTVYNGIYPDTINHPYYQEPGTQTWYKRRNLWYTFVVQGMGEASIKIQNLTSPGNVVAFKMYRSDVDGNLDFQDVLLNNELDSTLASGLTLVHTNIGGSCWRSVESTYTFINDICEVDTTKRRYYIIAELDEYYVSMPNVQMDLQIRWSPINSNPQDPKYDFYSHANVIGNNEDAPPYTTIPLQYNTYYSGGWGNMSCATGDTSDYVFYNDYWGCQYYSMDQRSLWWKFTLDQPGFIYVATESDATPASSFSRRLLMQTAPGDSIISTNGSTDLVSLGFGTSSGLTGSPYQWYRYCVEPGEYYYHVQRCADVDTSNVRAHVYFTPIAGDNCSNAPSATAATFGVYPLSIPILCHSMGDDFGEDGSHLGCLQGPTGYRSSWFKFNYTGTDLADILFQLNLSGISNYISAGNVRYRLFYGNDCVTMIEGQECSINAYINNSIACVSGANGAFYVQVTYPETTTGTLGFTFTVSPNTNPDCNPFDPTLMIADFFHQPNCTGDSIHFTNYSTSGSSVVYHWDFGDGQTSTETNPTHAYAPGSYDVTLSVINPILGDTVSMTQTITLSPSGSPLELGPDRTICVGESTTIGQSLTQATYVWSTGEVSDMIQVSIPGWYYLDIEWGGCPYSDSIQIHVLDLAIDLGPDTFFCFGDSVILDPVVSAGVTYQWSDGSTNDTLVVTQAGQYDLTISIGNCVKSDTIDVSVVDLSFTLGNDTIICAGSTLALNPVVASGSTYTWSDGSSGTSLSVQTAGTYSLTIENQGCTYTDDIVVDILDLTFDLGNDTLFCVNQDVTIQPVVPAGVAYTWSDGSTGTSLLVDTPGWYYLTIEKLGCTAIDSIYVNELDLHFDLGPDTVICAGANLTLNPQVMTGVSHVWSNGSTNPSITIDQPGTYSLTIERNGCQASDSMQLDVLDLSFSLGNDTVLCEGTGWWLQPNVLPGVNYQWSDGSTGSSLYVDAAGVISLQVDSLGCSASDDVNVSIFYVQAIVPTPFEICLMDTAMVQVAGVDSIQWTTGNGAITVLGNLLYGLHPSVTTDFYWTAFENGCQQTGMTSVTVFQPFIPVVSFDDAYCQNEDEVILPAIPGTVGNFYYQGNVITELPIANLAVGNHTLVYKYTDTTHSCPWEISLPFEIMDTTQVEFTQIPELCLDAVSLNLNTIINVTGGSFEVSYTQGAIPSIASSVFNPALLNEPINDPTQYQVSYAYTNNHQCVSHATGVVEVHPLPVVAYQVEDVCLNTELEFVNQSTVSGSDIQGYTWIIPGHSNVTDEIPLSISYATSGEYTVTLLVESTIGCVGAYTSQVEVFDLPVISIDPAGPYCRNVGLLPLPTATPAGGSWWLNNTSITELNSYNLPNPAVLTYRYTDANQCTDESNVQILIHDTTTLVISNPINAICANDNPYDLSSGVNVTSGQWSSMYDGLNWTLGNAFDPSLIVGWNMNEAAIIPLQFEYVNNEGCISRGQSTMVVNPIPVVDVEIEPVCAGGIFEIVNQSYTPDATTTANWTFEMHGGTNEWSPDGISYTEAGSYDYVLTLTSSEGCVAWTENQLVVHPNPVADFEWMGGCANEPVLMNSTGSVAQGTIDGYQWTLGGAVFGDMSEANYTFSNPGNFAVTLTVTSDENCIGTITKSIDVLPIPQGEIITEDHCMGESTQLSVVYVPTSGTNITSTWNIPGEVVNEVSSVIQHTFSSSGMHYITLEAVSENGCANTIVDSLRVYSLPNVSFDKDRIEICLHEFDTLMGTSSVELPSTVVNHHWQFSNGVTMNGNTLVFKGTSVGQVNLILTATTNHGCIAVSETQAVYFVRPLPFANFTLSPDVLTYEIPDLEVQDASSGAVIWDYEISDGSNVHQANFVHRFVRSGVYNIIQTVENIYGCRDTTSKQVELIPGLIVHIPNAFTPDNDGKNDVFYPVIFGDDITHYEFIIWDRWGMEIFRSTNPEEVWTGNVNGGTHYAKDEVYNYRLVVRGSRIGEEVYQGSVTLLR